MTNQQANGPRIKELREQHLWSQEQLCGVSDVSVRTIQRAERSEAVSFETLKNLGAAFKVDADRLVVPKTEEKEPPSTHEVVVLPEIRSGIELGALADCQGYLFSHDDPQSRENSEKLALFLQSLQDYGDIWEDIGAGGQVEARASLFELLHELEGGGFKAFGAPRLKKLILNDGESMTWLVGCLVITRDDDPRIVAGEDRAPAVLPTVYALEIPVGL